VQSANRAAILFHGAGVLSRWHPRYEFRPGPARNGRSRRVPRWPRKSTCWWMPDTGTAKNTRVLGAGAALRQAGGRLHRHQESARAAFLQGHSVSAATFRPAAASAYMKGRANFACRQKIFDPTVKTDSQRPGRNRRLSNHPRVGRRPPPTGDRSEIKTLPESRLRLAKGGRPPRSLHGPGSASNSSAASLTEMPAVAPTRGHHHRQSHLSSADLAVKRRRPAAIIPEYAAVGSSTKP